MLIEPAPAVGREESTDFYPILDPMRYRVGALKMPVRDPKTPVLQREPDDTISLLGRRGHLGQSSQHAQPDARREGTDLVHVESRAGGESRDKANRFRTPGPVVCP